MTTTTGVLTLEDLGAASRKGAAFAQLLRPGTIRMPVLVFVAAGLGESKGAAHLVGGVLLIIGAYGVATIVNDLADLEIDRVNGRTDRPLVTGDLAESDARLGLGLSAIAVAAAQLLLEQPLGLVVTAAAVALGLAYSGLGIDLQRRGLWAPALLAVNYFVLPMLLAGASLEPALVVALVAGGMATLLYKDMKDEAGDRALGKRTFLVRHGTAVLDRTATGLGMLAIAAGLVHAAVGWWTGAAVLALVLQLTMVRSGQRSGRPLRHQRLAAIAALVLLAATA